MHINLNCSHLVYWTPAGQKDQSSPNPRLIYPSRRYKTIVDLNQYFDLRKSIFKDTKWGGLDSCNWNKLYKTGEVFAKIIKESAF